MINFHYRIMCSFVVPTDSHCTTSFKYWHNGCRPISKFHGWNNTLLSQFLQLLLHLGRMVPYVLSWIVVLLFLSELNFHVKLISLRIQIHFGVSLEFPVIDFHTYISSKSILFHASWDEGISTNHDQGNLVHFHVQRWNPGFPSADLTYINIHFVMFSFRMKCILFYTCRAPYSKVRRVLYVR